MVPRLLRSQEVIGNQALALRKRWLISSFENKVLAKLREVRTDLNVFTPGEQLVLMNHGWALTDAALRSHGSAVVTSPLPPGQPPDARLLNDPAEALKALG